MKSLICALFVFLFTFPAFAQEYEMPTLADIKAELLQDPMSYGYAQYLGDNFNPPALAEMINLRRAEIVMPRPDVTPQELLEAIRIQDFVETQTVLMGSWFKSLLQCPSIRILKPNGSDSLVMKNIMRILVNSSASEVNVRALASRAGSRAEQLWGVGIVLSVQDVIDAVRS